MVDVVVNNVMALSTNPDLSTFLFKDKVFFHCRTPAENIDSLIFRCRSRFTTHTAPSITLISPVSSNAGWATRTLHFLTSRPRILPLSRRIATGSNHLSNNLILTVSALMVRPCNEFDFLLLSKISSADFSRKVRDFVLFDGRRPLTQIIQTR